MNAEALESILKRLDLLEAEVSELKRARLERLRRKKNHAGIFVKEIDPWDAKPRLGTLGN